MNRILDLIHISHNGSVAFDAWRASCCCDLAESWCFFPMFLFFEKEKQCKVTYPGSSRGWNASWRRDWAVPPLHEEASTRDEQRKSVADVLVFGQGKVVLFCHMRFCWEAVFIIFFFFDDRHQRMSVWLKSSCNVLRVMFAARREWHLLPPLWGVCDPTLIGCL